MSLSDVGDGRCLPGPSIPVSVPEVRQPSAYAPEAPDQSQDRLEAHDMTTMLKLADLYWPGFPHELNDR